MTRISNVQPLCTVCGKPKGNPDCPACRSVVVKAIPQPGPYVATNFGDPYNDVVVYGPTMRERPVALFYRWKDYRSELGWDALATARAFCDAMNKPSPSPLPPSVPEDWPPSHAPLPPGDRARACAEEIAHEHGVRFTFNPEPRVLEEIAAIIARHFPDAAEAKRYREALERCITEWGKRDCFLLPAELEALRLARLALTQGKDVKDA